MLNQAQIIGHLGRDPEVRYLPSGEAVANFSIATTEKWKDKQTGEFKEQTEWHRISAFGKLAEIVERFLQKGSLLYVSGKIVTRKYTDKDGVEKYTTEIRANEMKMLGGNKTEDQKPSQKPAQQKNSGFDDLSDDIPF
jgi:single-strand DNA-binding protein